MRISDVNVREGSDSVRGEAVIIWEDVDRSQSTWFVETDARFRDQFWPDPNGLLMGAILPAWHAGGRHVSVEGVLCPVMTSNVMITPGVLRDWYPEMGPAPAIEPVCGYQAQRSVQAQAASFVSYGIDSLASLRWNKLHLPADHPASITGVLYLEFLEQPDSAKTESLGRRVSGGCLCSG
jgi:hypothetical protein